MERVKESEQEYRGGDWGVKYLFRGPKIDWGVILLKPGQCLGGHYHHEVEETFYVLEGQATFLINDQKHVLEAGEAVRLEALDRHDVLNEGLESLKITFVKCPYLPKDKVDV